MKQQFVLQLSSGIFLGPKDRPRVALIQDALHFDAKSEAEALALNLRENWLFELLWVAVPAEPVMDPCAVLACVRLCIPNDAPTRDEDLRLWLPEIDATLAETKRANSRRCEGEVAA